GRKAARFLGGTEKRLGLVHAFLLLAVRIAVGDDPGAGLDIHRAVLHERSAEHDAGVHFARGGKIANAAGVETALFLFEFVDDLHRTHFRRAGHGAGGKARSQRIERVMLLVELAFDIRDDVHHLAVTLDEELVGHFHRANAIYAADIVSAEIE